MSPRECSGSPRFLRGRRARVVGGEHAGPSGCRGCPPWREQGGARLRSLLILTAVLLLTGHGAASAQFLEDFEERLWGLQFSFTPEWRSEELGGDLLGLPRLDISGSDFTVGFVRRRMRSGHWGLSLLRQRWQEAATTAKCACWEARKRSLSGSGWSMPPRRIRNGSWSGCSPDRPAVPRRTITWCRVYPSGNSDSCSALGEPTSAIVGAVPTVDVERVEFYVNGVPACTAPAPAPFECS